MIFEAPRQKILNPAQVVQYQVECNAIEIEWGLAAL